MYGSLLVNKLTNPYCKVLSESISLFILQWETQWKPGQQYENTGIHYQNVSMKRFIFMPRKQTYKNAERNAIGRLQYTKGEKVWE